MAGSVIGYVVHKRYEQIMVTNKEFTEWADWEGGLISLVIYHGVDINELEDQRLAFLVGQLKMKWDEHIAPLIDEINTICL